MFHRTGFKNGQRRSKRCAVDYQSKKPQTASSESIGLIKTCAILAKSVTIELYRLQCKHTDVSAWAIVFHYNIIDEIHRLTCVPPRWRLREFDAGHRQEGPNRRIRKAYHATMTSFVSANGARCDAAASCLRQREWPGLAKRADGWHRHRT